MRLALLALLKTNLASLCPNDQVHFLVSRRSLPAVWRNPLVAVSCDLHFLFCLSPVHNAPFLADMPFEN